jgi:AAHS family 4-hydroxybenzoate transporter-like MFS transporter
MEHSFERRQTVPSGSVPILIVAIIVAMLDGYDIQIVAFIAPVLAGEWGIAKSALGGLFAAALVGMMLGSILQGPLSDRWGRRAVLAGSVLGFGSLNLVTASTDDLQSMMAARFVTGLFLGAAGPNLVAIATENAPPHLRNFWVTLTAAGFPVGGFLGGLISAPLIPAFGWRSVLVIGGLLPLLMLIAIFKVLPADRPATRPAESRERPSLFVVFSRPWVVTSVLMWICFAGVQLAINFFVAWVPTLLSSMGFALNVAILTGASINIGALAGGAILGRRADRLGPAPIVAFALSCGIAACLLIAFAATQGGWFPLIAVAIAGFFVAGGGLVLNALPATIYPEAMRGTGLGWSLGMARLGGVLGPLLGGLLVSQQLSEPVLFAVSAVPVAIAALAALLLLARRPAA